MLGSVSVRYSDNLFRTLRSSLSMMALRTRVCFYDTKKELPLKWNFQTMFLWKDEFRGLSYKYHAEVEDACLNPGIVHYTADKPWYKNSPNPMKAVFYKYQDLTIWKGQNKVRRPDGLKKRLVHTLVCLKRRKISFYRSNYDERLFGIVEANYNLEYF